MLRGLVSFFFRLLEGGAFIATIVALIAISYIDLKIAAFAVGIGFVFCLDQLRKAAEEALS